MRSPFNLELGLSGPARDISGVSFIFQDQVDTLRRAHGNCPIYRSAIEQRESMKLAPLHLYEYGDRDSKAGDDQTRMLFGLFLQFMEMWFNRYSHHRRHLSHRREDHLERTPRKRYEPGESSFDLPPGAVRPAPALGSKLALAASHVAGRMNRTGRCAEGVQRALQAIGMPEFRGSGHAWSMLGPLLKSGKFELVPASQVTAGDIMVRRRPGDYGHIAIITGRDRHGNLTEASDHHASVRLNNPRYDRTVFLRLKSVTTR
ncbi:MAG: hypothetical protein AB7W16_29100 [Candidatus Obscuribacterales bacterium]